MNQQEFTILVTPDQARMLQEKYGDDERAKIKFLYTFLVYYEADILNFRPEEIKLCGWCWTKIGPDDYRIDWAVGVVYCSLPCLNSAKIANYCGEHYHRPYSPEQDDGSGGRCDHCGTWVSNGEGLYPVLNGEPGSDIEGLELENPQNYFPVDGRYCSTTCIIHEYEVNMELEKDIQLRNS